MISKKSCAWTLGIASGLALGAYALGDYFINYTLVPNQGAQDRQVKGNQKPNPIQHYQAQEVAATQDWLKHLGADQVRAVSLETKDGLELQGHTFSPKEGKAAKKPWIIILHGYQASEFTSMIHARHLADRGYPVLTYSLRAHAPSQGSYITMGAKDQEDLLAWTQWILDQDPGAQIVWHGTSMGGATVMLASDSSNHNLPQAIIAVINDCGYSNLRQILDHELDLRFGLPSFPIIHAAALVARLKVGIKLNQIDPLAAVQRSPLPLLTIHGQEDNFVPFEMAQAIQDTPGIREFIPVPAAGHAQSHWVLGEDYYQAIENFIQKHQTPH